MDGRDKQKLNYNVRIFAPGRKHTCVLNPLDFMRSPRDATSAKTIAINFHENLRGENQREDGFFAPSGQRVLYGCFMLAKDTIYPDLAMAFCLLKLPQLARRLVYATERKSAQYSFWAQTIFSQLVQMIESDKTMAGVMSEADKVISQFIQPDLLPCLIGGTNTSLLLGKKELLILQSDTKRKEVVNPLLASIAGLSIAENFGISRSIPIVYSFDEIATFKVDGIPDWVNIFRSQGYVSFYGAQSIEQYYKMYGRDNAAILRNTCGTRMWFNPGSIETAKNFSDYLGKKLHIIKNKSVSRSLGGRTITTAHQQKEVDLVENSQWLGFRSGELVYINPHTETAKHQQDGRGSIPWKIDTMPISQSDQARHQECQEIWFSKLYEKFTQHELSRRNQLDLELEVRNRSQLAEELLPLPPAKVKVPM